MKRPRSRLRRRHAAWLDDDFEDGGGEDWTIFGAGLSSCLEWERR
jgi:hypothetical protein